MGRSTMRADRPADAASHRRKKGPREGSRSRFPTRLSTTLADQFVGQAYPFGHSREPREQAAFRLVASLEDELALRHMGEQAITRCDA